MNPMKRATAPRKYQLSRLLRDTTASAAIWVGLLAIPLVGGASIGIDTARSYLVKTRLSHAIDAAALAGGGDLAAQTAAADIKMYFDANFVPGFLGSQLTDFRVIVADDNETVKVTATVTVPTTFASILGVQTVTVSEENVARRSVRGMELVLVMDNTGSMDSSGKITAMKNAANELIDTLYGARESIDNFHVGLVPYATVVNVGYQHTDWTSDYDPDDFDLVGAYSPTRLSWKGCVRARPYPLDTGDAPPSTAPFRTYIWQRDSTNDWRPNRYNESDYRQTHYSYVDGPNLSCPPPILPLTASKTTVKNSIAAMGAYKRFGTMSNVGLAWGWRVISPLWQSLWGGNTPNDLPVAYATPLTDKVVILLTDGKNQWSGYRNDYYTAYGYPDDGELVPNVTTTSSRDELNRRLAETCAAMKNQGITLYTITFKVGDSASLRNLYENCASTPDKYFDSPSNNELAAVFRTIGSQLSNLRLEK